MKAKVLIQSAGGPGFRHQHFKSRKISYCSFVTEKDVCERKSIKQINPTVEIYQYVTSPGQTLAHICSPSSQGTET